MQAANRSSFKRLSRSLEMIHGFGGPEGMARTGKVPGMASLGLGTDANSCPTSDWAGRFGMQHCKPFPRIGGIQHITLVLIRSNDASNFSQGKKRIQPIDGHEGRIINKLRLTKCRAICPKLGLLENPHLQHRAAWHRLHGDIAMRHNEVSSIASTWRQAQPRSSLAKLASLN